jgi:hypothetical protein
MTGTKNRTFYVSTAPIVPQHFADSNELVDLTDANLQLIKKTPCVQYDLGPSGILQVGLRGRGDLAFDINTLGEDDVDSLIQACLNNKTVVGYDLYKSFTFTRLRTERWKPGITLDIPSLMRTFNYLTPLVEGMTGFEQLISMTRTTVFYEAVHQIIEWDEAGDRIFLNVFERMPWIMAELFSDAIRVMDLEHSNRLTIGGYLTVNFSEHRAMLMSSTGAILFSFAPYYLSSVNKEFLTAVENLRNRLGLRSQEDA